MPTKSLSRTVIEGGRAAGNHWERRQSNALERRWEARVSARLLTMLELDDVLYPRRPKVCAGFREKLGPARRWLDAHVGEAWSKVQSELLQRFDVRTTASRHILYDHLLPSVEGAQSHFFPAEFSVDGAGILRRNRPRRRVRLTRAELGEPAEQDRMWMAGRRVALWGSAYLWFVPTATGAFRQDRRLTPADKTRFLARPKSYRDQYDALRSPAPAKPVSARAR